MSRQNHIGAIICSTLVLAAATGFGMYATNTQKTPGKTSYELAARFVSANGLARGADVDIAGVKVGRVSSITLDPASQMAIVRFRLDGALHLPTDSTLTIGSGTLSSENALMIEPGKATTLAQSGQMLTHTLEPTSLEQQVSNYIFGAGNLEQ
ncbi:MCE family protein [Acetobacter lambici]|uniref:MlaD family protein n=1 Tax=Acetobacter lambici TaxID=1332824 RepID=A0ABT1EVV9_9PROT|nr:MlaD family protein [Acetobacter lambici]MCP1241238.1 MlaD family protein [Acetobacter lambici]MCP1257091.1 MlaD family protein [Acetobacter lambici]NHO55584.1 MCE family protein [Acetobacter lambici]